MWGEGACLEIEEQGGIHPTPPTHCLDIHCMCICVRGKEREGEGEGEGEGERERERESESETSGHFVFSLL